MTRDSDTVRMLIAERADLLAHLDHGALDHLDVITRSFERRAVRARIIEIDEDIASLKGRTE